ncbi:hypothetical protein ACP70R_048504 [Stipagrostis hirtigluma subsp. patula]
MAFAHGSSHYSAVWALIASMELQFLWSFIGAILDTAHVVELLDPYNFVDVCFIVILDWIT